MSAFIVDRDHVDLLVTAALDLRERMHVYYVRPDGGPTDCMVVDHLSADVVGQRLWAENVASVWHRFTVNGTLARMEVTRVAGESSPSTTWWEVDCGYVGSNLTRLLGTNNPAAKDAIRGHLEAFAMEVTGQVGEAVENIVQSVRDDFAAGRHPAALPVGRVTDPCGAYPARGTCAWCQGPSEFAHFNKMQGATYGCRGESWCGRFTVVLDQCECAPECPGCGCVHDDDEESCPVVAAPSHP